MKRLLSILFLCTFTIALSACGGGTETGSQDQTVEEQCEDLNNNGICDDEEEQCEDLNNNDICDDQEEQCDDLNNNGICDDQEDQCEDLNNNDICDDQEEQCDDLNNNGICDDQEDQCEDLNNNDICDNEEEPADSDNDGITDDNDNCPSVVNPNQIDIDNDGIGDVCDNLIDNDGDDIANDIDNCPVVSNPDQADADGDGLGDACDDIIDSDNDGVANDSDNCPTNSNPDQADTDKDGIGDACDNFTDTDNDGIADHADNCPVNSNPDQTDTDNDGLGDACDSFTDSDNDGVADENDAFPNDPAETADSDNDGVGDNSDAFPNDPNETVDSDGDGVGDNADAFPNDPTRWEECEDLNDNGICDDEEEQEEDTATLYVNEIVAKDADGGNDWIEFYAAGTGSVNLANYSVVDDDDEHSPVALPDVTLNAGEFFVVEAIGDAEDATGEYYVLFKLGKADSVILSKDGETLQTLTWEEGQADEGYSYGLYTDGSENAQTLNPTKGYANEVADEEEEEVDNLIHLNTNSISVEGSGTTVDGTTVTITAAGIYTIDGTLSDGQIIIDSEDEEDVEIILDGVDIHCSTSAPIFVNSAKNAIITLNDGTTNYLSDGSTYVYANTEEDEPDATLFSKDDLKITGTGALVIDSNYNNAIKSKDDLVIKGGSITVDSVDDGVIGKDEIKIKDGVVLTITAQGDGLKSTNDSDETLGYVEIEGGTVSVTSGADAIQAETDIIISGGDITLVSGGGSNAYINKDSDSAKGLKVNDEIIISGGNITINAADDGIHSDNTIAIDGGEFSIASGDDGIHSEVDTTINGGEFSITKSYEGLESKVITINGGDFHITSSDDGINVAGGNDGSGTVTPGGRLGGGMESCSDCYLYINGGYVYVNATGDGLDANGSITMTDGTVIVNGPTAQDNGPLDYDGSFELTGGYLIAAGSSRMAQAPSTTSTQNSVLVTFSSTNSANTLVAIKNSSGENLVTFAPAKQYQSFVFSSAELTNGSYEVLTGGSSTGTVTDGLYEGGTYSGGSSYETFTVNSVVTTVGSSNNCIGPFCF